MLKRFGKRKQRLGDRDCTTPLSVLDRKSKKAVLRKLNDHRQLAEATGVTVYFTHPYSSTERASIENLNGLVRYYLPKRTSFATLTQRRFNELEKLLNHRPRKCLGYLTPDEVHSKTRPLRLRSERCI